MLSKHNKWILKNKYTTLYFSIIDNALSKKYDGYTERHHIIPKSLGGPNDKSNLVRLSAREHFLCHYLLTKMIDKTSESYKKIIYAFWMMKATNNNQNRYVNSRLYESCRKIHSEISTKRMIDSNHMKGMCWVSNFDLKSCIKITENELGDYLIKGYIKKRILDFNSYDENNEFIPTFTEKREEIIQHLSNKNKGKGYYTDGTKVITVFKDEIIPNGFVRCKKGDRKFNKFTRPPKFRWLLKNIETNEIIEVLKLMDWCREQGFYCASFYKNQTKWRIMEKSSI